MSSPVGRSLKRGSRRSCRCASRSASSRRRPAPSSRIARLRAAARLPPGKTFATFEERRLPRPLVQQLRELATGRFLEGAVNVLAFGLPGSGRAMLRALSATRSWNRHAVRFTPTYQLVQELLAAKRDLELPRLLRKLDVVELVILDDLGYVRQTAEEAEVLFTRS